MVAAGGFAKAGSGGFADVGGNGGSAGGSNGGSGGSGGDAFGGAIDNSATGVLTIKPRFGAKRGSKQFRVTNMITANQATLAGLELEVPPVPGNRVPAAARTVIQACSSSLAQQATRGSPVLAWAADSTSSTAAPR